MFAGLFIAGMTMLFVMLAMSGAGGGALDYWNDRFIYIDVVLASGLSFGLLYRSLTCAILLFSYFLLSNLLIIGETGDFRAIAMAAVMLWFFGRAVWGTFAWPGLPSPVPVNQLRRRPSGTDQPRIDRIFNSPYRLHRSLQSDAATIGPIPAMLPLRITARRQAPHNRYRAIGTAGMPPPRAWKGPAIRDSKGRLLLIIR